mmetsp:Transcript_94764/g.305024  ORF Transcript_94764/g.305024 Transcript_94764/m.305024 type:complete len:97 (+) Transcript_94764:836-1126(+)
MPADGGGEEVESAVESPESSEVPACPCGSTGEKHIQYTSNCTAASNQAEQSGVPSRACSVWLSCLTRSVELSMRRFAARHRTIAGNVPPDVTHANS